ncbi:MAG: glutamate-1-semialdehyde 2,1-aminomutase [Bacteroidia bacterium]
MNIAQSKALFSEAQQYIPGGVNSPVRAFKSVGGDPLFIIKAKGAWMYDADGNAYVDLINSWGPMILGHAWEGAERAVRDALSASFSFGAPGPAEVEMARIVTEAIDSVDLVRMVNSGTEATMSAIRLARGYTGRDKIIKFAGNYHGHGDSFLIAAGSGALTFGSPDSPGVTKGTAADTLIAEYNDLANVRSLVQAWPGEVAAIILEPVTGNMGVIVPDDEFIQGLRKLCDEHGILLIFDEVMTGFRLDYGGAQKLLGITPDLTCLGKIIGGGMPVGAYGGKREIMEFVSPQGPVYQAGTLSGNPIAMAAGIAQLSWLRDHPEIYQQLEQTTKSIADGLHSIFTRKGIPHHIGRIGSMFTLFFNEREVRNYEDAKASDTAAFGRFFKAMLAAGVYLPPSQFEAMFISTAIGDDEVGRILAAAEAALG